MTMIDFNRNLIIWILGICFIYGVDSCTPGEYEADPTDCGVFYECTYAKERIRKACPRGLQFNPVLEVCDWPENVGCNVVVVKPSTYDVPDGCTAAAVYCVELWLDSSSSITVHYKHDTECSRFCQCDLFGRIHDMPCAPGTLFNPDLQVCDWPHNVDCDADVDPAPPPVVPPESGESSGSDGSSESGRSGDGCTKAAVACNALWLDSSSSITLHFKHDTKCDRFCQCDLFGRVHDMPCAPGTLFNPDLQVCDWPHNVDCNADVDTTPPPVVPPESGEYGGSDGSDASGGPGDGCTKAAVACNALWLDSSSSITVHFKHDTECNRFCQCDLFGRIHDRPCASGTLFNPELQVCDWPHNVDCYTENAN